MTNSADNRAARPCCKKAWREAPNVDPGPCPEPAKAYSYTVSGQFAEHFCASHARSYGACLTPHQFDGSPDV